MKPEPLQGELPPGWGPVSQRVVGALLELGAEIYFSSFFDVRDPRAARTRYWAAPEYLSAARVLDMILIEDFKAHHMMSGWLVFCAHPTLDVMEGRYLGPAGWIDIVVQHFYDSLGAYPSALRFWDKTVWVDVSERASDDAA